MNCRGQKFGHDFPIVGGECKNCDVNQNHISGVREIVKKQDFFAKMAERKKQKSQWTRHQQDAVDTANLFDDMKSLGIYMRLFKRCNREGLIRCREWVNKNGNGNKGRLFVSVHKKFV